MRYDKLERIIENEGFYFEHKKEQKEVIMRFLNKVHLWAKIGA